MGLHRLEEKVRFSEFTELVLIEIGIFTNISLLSQSFKCINIFNKEMVLKLSKNSVLKR